MDVDGLMKDVVRGLFVLAGWIFVLGVAVGWLVRAWLG